MMIWQSFRLWTFFRLVVDEPYLFGQIAATNALSDVYAMGGTVKTAMNIVAFPDSLDDEILTQILKGGADKVLEAGGVLCGGHSIRDNEPKYGLSVTGFVHPDSIWANTGAKTGDLLIFYKKTWHRDDCGGQKYGYGQRKWFFGGGGFNDAFK